MKIKRLITLMLFFLTYNSYAEIQVEIGLMSCIKVHLLDNKPVYCAHDESPLFSDPDFLESFPSERLKFNPGLHTLGATDQVTRENFIETMLQDENECNESCVSTIKRAFLVKDEHRSNFQTVSNIENFRFDHRRYLANATAIAEDLGYSKIYLVGQIDTITNTTATVSIMFGREGEETMRLFKTNHNFKIFHRGDAHENRALRFLEGLRRPLSRGL